MNERTRWEKAATGALEWIVSHLDRFDPFVTAHIYDKEFGKRLIELAVSIYLYAQFTGDRDGEAVHKVIAVLQKVQERPDFADRLLRFPSEFIVGCDIYAILRLFGHDDSERRGLIQRAIDAGYPGYIERPPHRVMDVRLTLEWGGFRHKLPDMGTLCSLSILSPVPSALYLDREAAYALTHIVMFLYEYGLIQQPKAASLDVAAVRRTLSELIVVYCQERDWDLLGEVLLCCDCVGLLRSPVYELGWEEFLATQRDDGSFPGPERMPPQCEEDKYPRSFGRDYHTTIVGLIATSLHLARMDPAQGAEPEDSRDAIQFVGKTENSNAHLADGIKEDVALAINRTWHGLGKFLDAIKDEDRLELPRYYYEILLGLWICHASPFSEDGQFAEIARSIGEALAACPDQDGAYLAQLPLTLTVVVGAILSAYSAAPRSLTDFIRTVGDVLLRTPGEDAVADLEFCEKRVLFHRLGMHPAPNLVSSADILEYAQDLDLSTSGEKIDGLLLRVNSFTSYGTRRVVLDASERWVGDVLTGLACHAFRQGCFDRGCELLRAQARLGINATATFRSCIAFLCLQQRADGTFGFFGPEEAALKVKEPNLDLNLDFRLPTTLHCAWTLAEATRDGWQLFSKLPRMS